MDLWHQRVQPLSWQKTGPLLSRSTTARKQKINAKRGDRLTTLRPNNNVLVEREDPRPSFYRPKMLNDWLEWELTTCERVR